MPSPTTSSNIQIRRPQGVGFDEVAPGFDFVAHEHGEHAVGFDSVVDLHAQQAAYGRVHGGFPELLGVHFAQAFVALATDSVFGLADEPVHGFAEGGHGGFLGVVAVAAPHGGARGDESVEGLRGLRQHGVVGAVNEVDVKHGGFEVAVVTAHDA